MEGKICVSLVAHVDAGKTTFLKNIAQFLNKEVELDFHEEEKRRGITILSKFLNLSILDKDFIFLDTPGHFDLRNEVLSSLRASDYAVLLIDSNAKINSSTLDLIKTLKSSLIPTFIFLNKLDLGGYFEHEIKEELNKHFKIVSYGDDLDEEIASLDEDCFDYYMNHQKLTLELKRNALRNLKYTPLFKGSSLARKDLETFLGLLSELTYPYRLGNKEDYYAFKQVYLDHELYKYVRSFKAIHLKDHLLDDKVEAIRVYDGSKFEEVKVVKDGQIALIRGLDHLPLGHHIGLELKKNLFRFKIIFKGADEMRLYEALKELSLEREDLVISFDAKPYTIAFNSRLEGAIFKGIFLERYGLEVDFEEANTAYFESILEPKEIFTLCDDSFIHFYVRSLEDDTILIHGIKDERWLKIFLGVIEKRRGPLIGAPLLKMAFEIKELAINKKADEKEISELFNSAVSMALKESTKIILEKVLEVRVTVFDKSRLLNDARLLKLKILKDEEDFVNVKGRAEDLLKLKERGYDFSLKRELYERSPFVNAIINQIGYDPLKDEDYLPSSRVGKREMDLKETIEELHQKKIYRESIWRISDKEAKEAFGKAYPASKNEYVKKKENNNNKYKGKIKILDTIYIIDAYNVLYASNIDRTNLANARDELLELLYTYKVLKGVKMWVVFDAYMTLNTKDIKSGEDFKVIFTKNGEKADTYIERAVSQKSADYRFIVVTSDGPIQNAIFNKGAARLSSRAFISEYESLYKAMQRKLEKE